MEKMANKEIKKEVDIPGELSACWPGRSTAIGLPDPSLPSSFHHHQHDQVSKIIIANIILSICKQPRVNLYMFTYSSSSLHIEGDNLVFKEELNIALDS